jgi:hypothetical protein
LIWLLGHVACYSIEDIKPKHESKFRLQFISGWYTSGWYTSGWYT